jgi:transposase
MLSGELSREIDLLDSVIAGLLHAHDGYDAIRKLPGICPVLAAVIVAEVGDVRRFATAGRLCSWAGLTPRHRESDVKVARGHITKQGSPMLRWAMVEAIQRLPADTPIRRRRDVMIARRGKEARNIARTAAARQLLACVFYALRDGHARSLDRPLLQGRQAA